MEKKVEFKSGEEILRGSLFLPEGEGPFPGVVFFHGRGSDRMRYLPMAQKLAKNGIISLAFDFGGCGKSDGNFSKQSHKMGVDNGKAALEYLLDQDVDKNSIGIQGTSFGGYVAGMLLNEFNFIKSVVLRVPAAYSDKHYDLSPENFPRDVFFKDPSNWRDSSAYIGVSTFKGSLLVIEAESDELLSKEEVEKYYKNAKNAIRRKLWVQKNAQHSYRTNPAGLKEFQQKVVDWFLETL